MDRNEALLRRYAEEQNRGKKWYVCWAEENPEDTVVGFREDVATDVQIIKMLRKKHGKKMTYRCKTFEPDEEHWYFFNRLKVGERPLMGK